MHQPKLGLYADKLRVFPDPENTVDDGIVGMMDKISTQILFEAYSFGIFPWPHPELPLLWYSPDPRGVLDFSELHISRSLVKFIKKTKWKITFDQAFDEVLDECSKVPRPNQDGTWITNKMKRAYKQFHKDGYAHSVECWDGDELIGGLYGVYVAGVFSGESMFYKKDNASKLCLVKLIEKLKANGLSWIDTQMVTHNLKDFGANYISKEDFMSRLKKAKTDAQPIYLN